MGKLAIKLGKLGSALGILAGLIEICIGAHIRAWIGNKENPFVLGLITFFLSGIAFLSVFSAGNHIKPSNNRKLAIFLGVLLPATVCFTTVGRLWYLPGLLLVLTSILLAYEYWVRESKGSSPKKVSKKFWVYQIIGVIGSLFVLFSVIMAFINSNFGLFISETLVKADIFRFEVLPMDFIRITNLSSRVTMDIEVTLVLVIYLSLILGAIISLISILVKSRIFKGIGGILVFAGLVLFLIWLPGILAQTEFHSVRLKNIIGSLGLGWYISTIGMSLIMSTSIFEFQLGSYKS